MYLIPLFQYRKPATAAAEPNNVITHFQTTKLLPVISYVSQHVLPYYKVKPRHIISLLIQFYLLQTQTPTLKLPAQNWLNITKLWYKNDYGLPLYALIFFTTWREVGNPSTVRFEVKLCTVNLWGNGVKRRRWLRERWSWQAARRGASACTAAPIKTNHSGSQGYVQNAFYVIPSILSRERDAHKLCSRNIKRCCGFHFSIHGSSFINCF